ncbi:hypothetical protein Ddc_10485 [Ditylenchus destructor]|nr:hypothetical protein Ddc_10485 [Ditylenchus destructor]
MAIFFVLISLGILSCVSAQYNFQPAGLSIPQNNHHQQQLSGLGNVGQHGWGNVPQVNHFQMPQMPNQQGWNPFHGGSPHVRPNFPLQQHYGPLGQHVGHPQQHFGLPQQPFGPPQWQPQGNSHPSGRRMDPALHRLLYGHDTSEQSLDSSEEFPGNANENQIPPHLGRGAHGGFGPMPSEEEMPGQLNQGLGPVSPLDDEDDDSESDESDEPLPDRLPGSPRGHSGLPSPAQLAAELVELLKGLPSLIPLITGENENPMGASGEDDEDSDSNEDDYSKVLLPDNLPSPSEEDLQNESENNVIEDMNKEGSHAIRVGHIPDKPEEVAALVAVLNNDGKDSPDPDSLVSNIVNEVHTSDEDSGITLMLQDADEELLFGVFTTNSCPKTCGKCVADEDDLPPPSAEVADPNDAVDPREDVLNQLLAGDTQGLDRSEPEGPNDLSVPDDVLEDDDDSEDGPDDEPGMPPNGDQDDDLDDLPQPDNLLDDQPSESVRPQQTPHNPRGPPLEAQLAPQPQAQLPPQAPQEKQVPQNNDGEQPEDSTPGHH